MHEEFDYFANRLLADEVDYPDGRHGLEDMRIIRGIHEAADTRGPVEL